MRSLNVVTRVYLVLVAIIALIIASLSIGFNRDQPELLRDFILLTATATIAEVYQLQLTRQYLVSAQTAVLIAIILILPPPIAVLASFVSITLEQMLHQHLPWYKRVFNICHHVIITGLPAILLYLGDEWTDIRKIQASMLFIFVPLFVFLYYFLDVLMVDLAISLSTGESLWKLWKVTSFDTILFDLSLAAIGIIMAIVWLQSPIFCLLLLLPVMVNQIAVANLKRLEQETQEAILAITDIVEARDPYTFGHSVRVAEHCRDICLALGLTEAQTERIVLAGRVHDLGKIGVSDAVLRKPGKLEESEWEEMRKHPVTGAQILANFSLYRDGIKDVLYHHEAWGGWGYPQRLKAEQIPLGARIIAVADAFDAMTTDRPYRRAMSVEKALAILEEGKNQQWESRIVTEFSKIIKSRTVDQSC